MRGVLTFKRARAAILASRSGILGDVERARLLVHQAIRRARELGHAATIVHVVSWSAYLEIRRDDVTATRLAAGALIKLAEKHGINLYAVMGQMCAYWASGRLVDPEAARERAEASSPSLYGPGQQGHAPFFHGMLAELEAATRRS